MKRDEFTTKVSNNEVRRTVIMNGEEMELGNDGEYHACKSKQFPKLFMIGACYSLIFATCLVIAAYILSPPTIKSTSSYADTETVDAKDPYYTPDAKSPLKGHGIDPPRTDYSSNAEKDPVGVLINDDRLYTLTIQYYYIEGRICPEQTKQMHAGDEFSVSVPYVDGYQPNISNVTGRMPNSDLVYMVYYQKTPEKSTGE